MTSERHLPDDWFPAPLPPNVVVPVTSYLHSSFALLHYRSEHDCGLRIGEHCSIYDGSCFDLGPKGVVEIGDYCLMWSATICANSRVTIGSYVFMSGEVFISDSWAPRPPVDRDYDVAPSHSASIVIEDDCWLGVRTTILAGTHLHRGAIVGAGAVVDFEVPAYAIVAGNPARVVGSTKPEGDALDARAGG